MLLTAALPAGITTTWEAHCETRTKRRRRPSRQRGGPLPPPVPIQEPTRGEEVRPRGPISIEQLFYGVYHRQCRYKSRPVARRYAHGVRSAEQLFYQDVYKLHVLTWLDAAGNAMEALLSGKRPQRVPNVVITPENQPIWARGEIWDCADRTDCRLIRRSTATSKSEGAKTINAAAIQTMAQE